MGDSVGMSGLFPTIIQSSISDSHDTYEIKEIGERTKDRASERGKKEGERVGGREEMRGRKDATNLAKEGLAAEELP